MRVVLLGVGEAFDENHGNTSALVRAESTVLLDCGYAAPFQLWRYDASPDLLDAVYITHAHADHYFGLPPLLVRMWEDGRTRPLTLISQPAVLERIWQLMDFAYSGLKERLTFKVERLEVSEGFDLNWREFRMRFAPGLHSVTNLAIRMDYQGRSFCYSGDGMFTEQGRTLFSGADLVLHEAYSFEPSPVHADIPRLISMAEECGIQHLVLTHVQRHVRKDGARLATLRSTTRLTLAHALDEFVLNAA